MSDLSPTPAATPQVFRTVDQQLRTRLVTVAEDQGDGLYLLRSTLVDGGDPHVMVVRRTEHGGWTAETPELTDSSGWTAHRYQWSAPLLPRRMETWLDETVGVARA